MLLDNIGWLPVIGKNNEYLCYMSLLSKEGCAIQFFDFTTQVVIMLTILNNCRVPFTMFVLRLDSLKRQTRWGDRGVYF